MPQDDHTTSSDPRASRSARRSVVEQEAKRRAAPSSRSVQPGAQSSSSRPSDVSAEADIESRNNHRTSRDRRDHQHRHRDDRRESSRRSPHRSSNRSSDRDDRDRESKRRATHGRSTSVGATSVATTGGGSKDEVRKRREEDYRQSKRRVRNDSSSGASALAPGARHGSITTEDARERKLREAGLGLNDNKTDQKSSDYDKNDKKIYPSLGQSAAIGSDAPDAASVDDDDDAINIQAVLVDEEEKNNDIKATMAKENERLKREMAAENERLRKQMEEDQNRLREEMQQQSNQEAEAAKARQKRNRMICIAIVIVVLIGAGVGAYFGTQGGDKTMASSPVTSDPPVTIPPTAATPASPTEAPIAPEVTAAPTEVPQLYEPPSDEDCTNIANADPVRGQEDSTEVFSFDTTFEMTMTTSFANANVALPLLQEQLQRRIMTKLAGCTPKQVGRRGLRHATTTVESRRRRRRRQLQANNNKYVVLNAQIASIEVLADITCKNNAAAAAADCSKILAKMDMYLQGEERPFVLMNRLIRLLDAGDDQDFDLARELGLPATTVASLSLDSIIVSNDDPTRAPTDSPPTTGPSNAPTQTTTPAPTLPPTTQATTSVPTPPPTPVVIPTPGPTTRPPRPPTNRPTPAATPGSTEPECTNFCRGDRACEGFDLDLYEVGCDSCTGDKSCLDAQAEIGDGSCKNGGCEGMSGVVGDFSCVGRGACNELADVTIGDNSCTCERCCACIREGDTIPDGSCTAIAEIAADVEYRPYETLERVEFCCQAPNGGGSTGDNTGGGSGISPTNPPGGGGGTNPPGGDSGGTRPVPPN